ncbi:MAG: AAA family ATPase [Patescibacteria group bacterium]|nr:AAA family ATPase [Patescibacteria group bacterium]
MTTVSDLFKRVVVLEGIDGAGKGAVLERFCQALEARGIPVLRTAEPTSGEWGVRIRRALNKEDREVQRPRDPLEFQAWYDRDRQEHMRDVEEWLRKNPIGVVVSDRGVPSTIAYALAEGADEEALRTMVKWTPRPGTIVFLRVLPEVARRRRQERDRPLEGFEEDTFQGKLEAAYGRVPEFGFPMEWVDNNGDGNQAIESTVRHILHLVMPRLRDAGVRGIA